MKLELTSTKVNSLINRKELSFKIEEKNTPNKSDVRREIAVIMRTQPENVYIRKLTPKSGTLITIGLAHVYDTPENAKKVEPKHIILRNDGKPKTDEKNTKDKEASS